MSKFIASVFSILILTLSASAFAQSEYTGEQAARIYNSMTTPATRYSSADHTYVIFVKETDWVKCSVYSSGEVAEPSPASTYRCEMKAVVY
jgi:hypothetical protein